MLSAKIIPRYFRAYPSLLRRAGNMLNFKMKIPYYVIKQGLEVLSTYYYQDEFLVNYRYL